MGCTVGFGAEVLVACGRGVVCGTAVFADCDMGVFVDCETDAFVDCGAGVFVTDESRVELTFNT